MRDLASIYRGRRLADLTGKGQSPVVPLGYENRQEVDPAWPPVWTPSRLQPSAARVLQNRRSAVPARARPQGPTLVTAAGLGTLFMPITLVALSRVPDHDAGLASSLPNVGREVGGSIGLALPGTVAWTVVANTACGSAASIAAEARAGHPPAGTAAQIKTAIYDHALSIGFSRGFEVSAGIMLIVTIAAIRVKRADLADAQTTITNRWPWMMGRP